MLLSDFDVDGQLLRQRNHTVGRSMNPLKNLT